LTTFKKLSNLDRKDRFDNFQKVVKSRPKKTGLDLTTFKKLSNLDRTRPIWQLSKSCQISTEQDRFRFDNFQKVVKSRPKKTGLDL